jgi:hypothetical protein
MKSTMHRCSVITGQTTASQRVSQPGKVVVNNRPGSIAQRQLQERITTALSQPKQLKKAGLAVAQRVVYKGTDYNAKEKQKEFVTEAKSNLQALSVPVDKQAEGLLVKLSKSALQISTVEDLKQLHDTWYESNTVVRTDARDSLKLDDIIACLDETLPTSLPAALAALLAANDVAKEELEQIKQTATTKLSEFVRNVTAIDAKKHNINLQEHTNLVKDAAQNFITSDKKDNKKLNDIKKKLSIVKGSAEKAIRDLQEQGQVNFVKGVVGYRYSQRPEGNTLPFTKLYIGQIEDTQAAKEASSSKGKEKTRGILYASPWSRGVNNSFMKGGIALGRVFKLKTTIPENLVGFLQNGDIDGFKAAVKDQQDKKYYPFWHSLRNDFTIFTNEIEMLVKRGYVLHTFSRKKGGNQQLMALASDKQELETYYTAT